MATRRVLDNRFSLVNSCVPHLWFMILHLGQISHIPSSQMTQLGENIYTVNRIRTWTRKMYFSLEKLNWKVKGIHNEIVLNSSIWHLKTRLVSTFLPWYLLWPGNILKQSNRDHLLSWFINVYHLQPSTYKLITPTITMGSELDW